MKKGILTLILLVTTMLLLLSGCGTDQNKDQTASPSGTDSTGEVTAEAEVTEEVTEQAEEKASEKMLRLKIDDRDVEVSWEDNESVQALKELCEDEPLTIEMSGYGDFEQVGSIGSTLPDQDTEITTEVGDIVLYSGNQIVVFYGSNSWAYTKLGHITDRDEDEMKDLLSGGDVTLTIHMEEQ